MLVSRGRTAAAYPAAERRAWADCTGADYTSPTFSHSESSERSSYDRIENENSVPFDQNLIDEISSPGIAAFDIQPAIHGQATCAANTGWSAPKALPLWGAVTAVVSIWTGGLIAFVAGAPADGVVAGAIIGTAGALVEWTAHRAE
jgi:hypothetical protein